MTALPRIAVPVVVSLTIVLAGCTTATPAGTAVVSSSPIESSAPTASPAPSPTSSIRDVMALAPFFPLEPGTYFIDPDGDAGTSLRVVYEIPASGWQEWIGAAKFSDVGHSGVSVTTVTNLVTDGCRDHAWADPPVGSSVEDLATALSGLAPFRVTSRPTDVTIWGYRGKHLEWIVPDMPVTGGVDQRRFTGCDEGKLKSWVAFIDTAEPGDAFYGYTGPGYTEEFWLLDVEGTRLMIAAERSSGSPPEDLAELRAILDSIRIEP